MPAALRLSADVLIRFEPYLDGGTLFLFHIETGAIWTGNADTYALLQALDGGRTLPQACDWLLAHHPGARPEEIARGVAAAAQQLQVAGFLEVAS